MLKTRKELLAQIEFLENRIKHLEAELIDKDYLEKEFARVSAKLLELQTKSKKSRKSTK